MTFPTAHNHPRTFVYAPGPKEKRTPPPARAAALAFIKAEIAAGRPFPDNRTLSQAMGWKSDGGAGHCLMCLYAIDGQIRFKDGVKGRPQQWELAEP